MPLNEKLLSSSELSFATMKSCSDLDCCFGQVVTLKVSLEAVDDEWKDAKQFAEISCQDGLARAQEFNPISRLNYVLTIINLRGSWVMNSSQRNCGKVSMAFTLAVITSRKFNWKLFSIDTESMIGWQLTWNNGSGSMRGSKETVFR